MFFSGRLPRPPWETRGRVEALIKRCDRGVSMGTGDRFRFQTLQSRFQAFVELWDRGLRAREEGRPGPFAQPPPKGAARRPRRPDKVLNVASFTDPVREMDKLHSLYDSLMDARRQARRRRRAVPQVRRAREGPGDEAARRGQLRGRVPRGREGRKGELYGEPAKKEGKRDGRVKGANWRPEAPGPLRLRSP